MCLEPIIQNATTWKKEIISKWDFEKRRQDLENCCQKQSTTNVEDAHDDATDVSSTSAATALVSDADDSIYFTKIKGFQDKNSVA